MSEKEGQLKKIIDMLNNIKEILNKSKLDNRLNIIESLYQIYRQIEIATGRDYSNQLDGLFDDLFELSLGFESMDELLSYLFEKYET